MSQKPSERTSARELLPLPNQYAVELSQERNFTAVFVIFLFCFVSSSLISITRLPNTHKREKFGLVQRDSETMRTGAQQAKGPFTPKTNWHSSRIEQTNCHWNVWEFVHSIRDEFEFVSSVDTPEHFNGKCLQEKPASTHSSVRVLWDVHWTNTRWSVFDLCCFHSQWLLPCLSLIPHKHRRTKHWKRNNQRRKALTSSSSSSQPSSSDRYPWGTKNPSSSSSSSSPSSSSFCKRIRILWLKDMPTWKLIRMLTTLRGWGQIQGVGPWSSTVSRVWNKTRQFTELVATRYLRMGQTFSRLLFFPLIITVNFIVQQLLKDEKHRPFRWSPPIFHKNRRENIFFLFESRQLIFLKFFCRI